MKYLISVISFFAVISLSYARANLCEVGTMTTDDCNVCMCNRSGMWACTSMLCENHQAIESNEVSTSSEVESQPGINEPGYKCVPNSFFKDDCNSCSCDKTGTFARCTMMTCPPQKRFKRSQGSETYQKTNGIRKTQPELENSNSVFCVTGEFKKEGCKICECVESRTWRCGYLTCTGSTRKPMAQKQLRHDQAVLERECDPDAQKQKNNNCRCTETGVWDCNLTDIPSRPKRHFYKIPKISSINQKDHNEIRSPLEEVRDEVEIKQDTSIPAEPTVVPKQTQQGGVVDSGDIVTPEEFDTEDFRCKPNSTFKLECNTCWCRSDGKGAKYCTRIACQPKTYKPLLQN